MVRLGSAIPRNISFTSKRNIRRDIFIISNSYRQVLFPTRLTYQAINYFHSIVGHEEACNSELCLNIFEGIKRTIRYRVQKESSITVKHLYSTVSTINSQTCRHQKILYKIYFQSNNNH